MEPTDPVTVYEVWNHVEAELIKNALAAEGIPCLLAGIEQANTAGLPGTKIQVQVRAEDGDRARKLLESFEHHERHRKSE